MARIKGVDIPNNKNIRIALTSIYGIGQKLSEKICDAAKIDKAKNCLNTVSSDFKSLTGQLEQSITEISQRLAELSKGLDDSTR